MLNGMFLTGCCKQPFPGSSLHKMYSEGITIDSLLPAAYTGNIVTGIHSNDL